MSYKTKDTKVLLRYQFNPLYLLNGKQQTPLWGWLTSREADIICKRAAVVLQGGFGYPKNVKEIEKKMTWHKENKEGYEDAVIENLYAFEGLKRVVSDMVKKRETMSQVKCLETFSYYRVVGYTNPDGSKGFVFQASPILANEAEGRVIKEEDWYEVSESPEEYRSFFHYYMTIAGISTDDIEALLQNVVFINTEEIGA